MNHNDVLAALVQNGPCSVVVGPGVKYDADRMYREYMINLADAGYIPNCGPFPHEEVTQYGRLDEKWSRPRNMTYILYGVAVSNSLLTWYRMSRLDMFGCACLTCLSRSRSLAASSSQPR